jgi:uroporphyrinogen-III decarboxylase
MSPPHEMTHKQRMLNAYAGAPVDVTPVAPEFWCYYPAKVMHVDMVEFEREVPFWKGLRQTFSRFGSEGWGAVFAAPRYHQTRVKIDFRNIGEGRYRETKSLWLRGEPLVETRIFSKDTPSWMERYPVKNERELNEYVEIMLNEENEYSFEAAQAAHAEVGGDYLLEASVGDPFFDFFERAMGFEAAAEYFLSGNDQMLSGIRDRYTEYHKNLVRKICQETNFESLFIGCSSSCNSLLGPRLWRAWDKPYLSEMAREIHKHGRYLHMHFHGRCLETVRDLVEIGADCVCPFERPPGGDVDGGAGLRLVRQRLCDTTTMNGNVHTVETLIRGTPQKVRDEVREIRDAFRGSNRVIIGTGDQVGRETPEENIYAMIDEARKPSAPPSGA